MKKIFIALLLGGVSLMSNAQYTFDVLKMSETELSGTSRYMSMAGAFGALGGDVSAVSQNPGGIGVYRSSDIALTGNVNFLSTKSSDYPKLTDTKFNINNIAYVGSMKIENDFFKYFNWGFSYNRVNSFNRRYQGGYTNGYSLTNRIADYLNNGNWIDEDMSTRYPDNNGYFSVNPYYPNDRFEEGVFEEPAPWLGILAYQSYLLNADRNSGQLSGLQTNGTTNLSEFYVEEKGYTDEYNITLGGNFKNVVFWGLNFGITDLHFDSYQYFGETLEDAVFSDYNSSYIYYNEQNKHGKHITGLIPGDRSYLDYIDENNIGLKTGKAEYCLESLQETRGTGYNFKMGVIVKPINQLRIGAAFHTPTYYDMKEYYKVYSDVNLDGIPIGGTETGEYGIADEYRYTIKTPWRFIGSVAVVPNSKGLISLDYEYVGAQTMRCGDDRGNNYGDTEYMIKKQLQPSHILRVGAEYRVTPNLSLRAGYSYQSSPVKDEVKGVENENVDVSSSNYMYQYDKNNQYITAGIGYRYRHFYADAAYVHRTRTSMYHAFPGELGEEVKDNNNKIALTVGFRF